MPTMLGKYQIGHTLGSGVSCKVKIAKDNSGQRYAVKILHNDEAFLDLIKAEVANLRALKHPNIVNLIEEGQGTMSNPKKGNKVVDYLVLELVNGGDLFDFVSTSGRFSEETARYYMNQFMDGLDYMHQNNCAHRDLKPENIMLDNEFNLKIADFGFAAPASGRDGSGFLHTQLGTQSYMAPEIHLNKPYTGPGVDLFAAAIIMFVMVSQRPPFNSPQPQDPYYRLLAADRSDLFWKAHDDAEGGESIYSAEFKDLFTLMTKLNPAQRPDMDQVRAHPWMQGPRPNKNQILQEFRNRKTSVDAEVENEREEKKNERHARRYDHSTSRGSGSMTEDEKAQYLLDKEAWEEIELGDYEETTYNGTQFFTTSKVMPIAFDLRSLLQEKWEIIPSMDSEAGKIKFQLKDERIAESNPIKVTVKFTKVDDDKNCIEFNRRSGDKMIYLEKFKEIIESDLMKVYKDTTLL